jgi:hypothetical protein
MEANYTNEFPDARLKYIEMPNQFQGRANEISLTCKQHLRTCEALAKRLAFEKPKTKQEFEKVEYYKDFVIKSAELNEQVLGLVEYTHSLLSSIAADSVLLEEAKTKDTLRLQSETIELLYQQNDKLVKDLHERLRENKKAA